MNSAQITALDTIATLRADVDGSQPMLRPERAAALSFLAGIEGLIRADRDAAAHPGLFAGG